MTYYCIIIVPKSLSFRCAVAAFISPFPCGHPLDRRQSSRQTGDIRQYVASQAQERTKQREQPDSPIKTCPLPEVSWTDYKGQSKAKSAEKRYGMEQIQTRFHKASLSIPLWGYLVAPQPEQR